MPLPRKFCALLSLRRAPVLSTIAAILLSSAFVAAQSIDLSADPPSLTFGDVQTGTRSTLPVVLTNRGTSEMTITRGRIRGVGYFVHDAKLPITLNPGQSFTLNVSFAPKAAGAAPGEILAWSSAVPVMTIPLNASGTLSGYAVSLSWNPSTTPEIVGYNVYRGTISGGPYTRINSALETSPNYTDYTVPPGQNSYYVTTSVNASGVESTYSNQTRVMIPRPIS
jgi:hypothetical protein